MDERPSAESPDSPQTAEAVEIRVVNADFAVKGVFP
jgi:hypothetical protein